MASHFEPVDPRVNFIAKEEEILEWWDENDIPARYRHLNDDKEKNFSFIDGPITANNIIPLSSVVPSCGIFYASIKSIWAEVS